MRHLDLTVFPNQMEIKERVKQEDVFGKKMILVKMLHGVTSKTVSAITWILNKDLLIT